MSDPKSKPRFTIRPAVPDDCEALVALIRELAIYEKLEQFAKAGAADLRKNLFGPRPYAEALIAEVDSAAVGMALYFHTFSTFRGQPGIHLEDVFVQPEHRGLGIGKALLGTLAGIARERGCGRLEWAVLDWNKTAIGFYKSLGGSPLDEWITFRIADEPLDRLARFAPDPNAP